MFAAVVVLASLIGQVDQPLSWYRAVYPDGSTRIVRGWNDNGHVAYDEADQPYVDGCPKFRREPAPKNYGIDVPSMRNEKRVIRASDPDTLARVERDLARRKPRCPGPDCPDEPGKRPLDPLKRVEADMNFWGACAIGAGLFLAGIAVIGRSRK